MSPADPAIPAYNAKVKKSKIRRVCLLGLIPLLAFGSASARFPVIGYFASWSGPADGIAFDKMTHVIYSFAGTGADAGIGVEDEGRLRDLAARARQAGTKVGIAVGGWGADQAFIAMASTAAGRERFAANASAFCDRLGLDGVDIDWEFPTTATADDFEALMKVLAETLHKKGRFLSAAVKSRDIYVKDPEVGQNFKSGVFAYADFLNVMAYDGGGQNHAPYEMAVREMDYWVKTRGCPRHKVILGVPFYGKELKPDGKEVAVAYKDVSYQDRLVHARDNSGALYYNGIATIEKKARLASQLGGGLMIWEVAQDSRDETSLLNAIHKLASTFPDVPVVSIKPAPARSVPAYGRGNFPWEFDLAGRALPAPAR